MEVVKDQWFPSTGTVNGSKIRHRNPMGRQRSSSRTTERGDSETDTENIGPIDSSSARVFRSISQFHSNKTFDRSELTIPLCGSNCHISNSNDVEEDGRSLWHFEHSLPLLMLNEVIGKENINFFCLVLGFMNNQTAFGGSGSLFFSGKTLSCFASLWR